ncbi:MAG: amidohydrolase 2 [Acidimicrobiia bacterium]|nr:amidohydrolase 2 [Acidimicrobiia bacterium]
MSTSSRRASRADAPAIDLEAPVPIVSCDGHIGPRLSDMRDYCPKDLLEQYDQLEAQLGAMAQQYAALAPEATTQSPAAVIRAEQAARMRAVEGAHDMHARIRDMDSDGIVAEIVFHGVQDLRPVPWVGLAGFTLGDLIDPAAMELGRIGMRIYNQWLADACSIEPERHVAAALLPLWDIDLAIKELTWARQHGLKAVNFPSPRRGLRFYDEPEWEPFWSACDDLEMPLITHAGALDREDSYSTGKHAPLLQSTELGGWPSRRALGRMIFSGVFERHPSLKLLLVEQNHHWWTATIDEFDSAYQSNSWIIEDEVPRPPSAYLHDNVFIGASFMAPFEARAAIDEGYASNVMWGRDYPHVEGTFQPPVDGDDRNMTLASLRYCFADIDPADTQAMLSDNAIRILGLDASVLTKVAERIGSPSLAQIAEPLDAIPEPGRGGALSFRTRGPWG